MPDGWKSVRRASLDPTRLSIGDAPGCWFQYSMTSSLKGGGRLPAEPGAVMLVTVKAMLRNVKEASLSRGFTLFSCNGIQRESCMGRSLRGSGGHSGDGVCSSRLSGKPVCLAGKLPMILSRRAVVERRHHAPQVIVPTCVPQR